MSTSDSSPVLVTGASGFVAMHCIARLLADGKRVRGTVRDEARGEQVRQLLAKHVDVRRLSLVKAELDRETGWAEAVRGCSHVLHIASPVPRKPAKTAEEVIAPARDGALRVLKACSEAGARRVVMTSSTAAVIWGRNRDGSRVYDEKDWSELNEEVGPYERSKTLAERAAWEYVDGLSSRSRLELTTILPGLVLGPVFGGSHSISGEVIRKLLAGELPGVPDLGFAAVDARDLADIHVTALTHPDAANQRFIAAIEHAPWLEMAKILAEHYGPRGLRVPTRKLPSFVLKLVAVFDKTTALAVPELGKRQDVSSEKARRILGWRSRDLKTMVIDMAESMIDLGVVKGPRSRMVSDKLAAE